MPTLAARSDEQLLRSAEPEDFGRFYDRHARAVLAYFAGRVQDPAMVAELTAETFAAALVGRERRSGDAPPASWLFALAATRLAGYHRRGRVADRMRRRAGLPRRELGPGDAELLRQLGAGDARVLEVRLLARSCTACAPTS